MNLNKEKNLIKKGFKSIVGLDEAGRGAWAGPLVAGCVMMKANMDLRKKEYFFLQQVNDSKKLTPTNRERLFKIIDDTLNWSVGIVSVREIETMGINQANRQALIRAFNNLKKTADFALVDFWQNLSLGISNQGFVRADSRFFTVAAASIVAKVYRDNMMMQLDQENNQWQFAKHKGYGTKEHAQAIKKYGLSHHHRLSFLSNF